MSDPGSSFFNRRDLARTALIGGASALVSAATLSAQSPPAGKDLLDARQFGAIGDGHTDDTAALQRAIDSAAEKSGGVFLPPTVYLTGELHVRPGIALVGIPAWNYSGPGGTTLRLAGPNAPGLLNLTDARGATVDGLALDGRNMGKNVHGIFTSRAAYGPHEDGFRIERCQIAHFSGDGISLSHAWGFSVRHCELMAHHGDGLRLGG